MAIDRPIPAPLVNVNGDGDGACNSSGARTSHRRLQLWLLLTLLALLGLAALPQWRDAAWWVELLVAPGPPARVSHTPPTADADLFAVARRAPSDRLDVVPTTPAPVSSPRAAPRRPLDALATERHEKPGLSVWLLLLLLQCLCALLMIPSLPLIVAASLLFPQQSGAVLALALLGVLCSATLIHVNARWIGLDQQWQQRHRARRGARWIQRHGSPALCLWCMAPFLPSDLGCYLAAAARMPLPRYLGAVLLGEGVLCASIIYGVRGLAG